jgi:ABC-type uncharacterized transport system auxiliary subunit
MKARKAMKAHHGGAALAALALAGGCLGGLGGGAAAPPVQYYTLTAPAAATSRAGAGRTIAVEELRADAPFDDRRMVHRAGNYRLVYDDDHQWAAAPGVLVSDCLRRAYQSTGRFGMVLSEPSSETTAILGGRLLAFEQLDDRARAGHKAPRARSGVGRIALELQLRDAESGRILWTRRTEQRIRLDQPTPDALAAALSRALGSIAADTAPALAGALTASAR